GMRPVETQKSTTPGPASISDGPCAVPLPSPPWHTAQSRRKTARTSGCGAARPVRSGAAGARASPTPASPTVSPTSNRAARVAVPPSRPDRTARSLGPARQSLPWCGAGQTSRVVERGLRWVGPHRGAARLLLGCPRTGGDAGPSSSKRGGQRSGTRRPKVRTREQLYNEAKKYGVQGRSRMTKAQLQRAAGSDREPPRSGRSLRTASSAFYETTVTRATASRQRRRANRDTAMVPKTAKIPMHHAKLSATQYAVLWPRPTLSAPPSKRLRIALLKIVNGWLSATGCIQPGSVSAGTEAADTNAGGAMRSVALPVAGCALFGCRPVGMESHEKL